MTRYRFRGIFLLFLMGHATACMSGSSWQSPGTSVSPSGGVITDVSVVDYLAENQPDQVRITTQDSTLVTIRKPSVEGDMIVSSIGEGRSVPIADIVLLEVYGNPSPMLGILAGAGLVVLLIVGLKGATDPCGPLSYGGWAC